MLSGICFTAFIEYENAYFDHDHKFQYGGNTLHYKDDSKQEYSVSLHLGLTDYRFCLTICINF